MNNKTIRRLYAIGLLAALILFAFMVWDHYGNDNGWITPLTIIFIVVVVLLIIMLFLRAGAESIQFTPIAAKVRTGHPEDYLGDVHEVVDLEGIGPTYAKKLHDAGILNTQQLLFTQTAKVTSVTGAPAKTVEGWKTMSQLIKVRGIGPQYAEAMSRAGIDSVEELINEPAAAIAGAVQGYLDSLKSSVIGTKITTKRVEGWQRAARKLERGPIDMTTIKVMPLESKAAIAGDS